MFLLQLCSLYGFTLTCIVLFLHRQADPNSLPMTLAQMVSYEVLLVLVLLFEFLTHSYTNDFG